MKKIKIIDIFCKINCGEEVPHKIMYGNHIYTYNSDVQDYDLNDNCEYLFEHLFKYQDTSIILELELEILDEEDEFEDIEEIDNNEFCEKNNVAKTFDLYERVCLLIKNQKKIIERLKNE